MNFTCSTCIESFSSKSDISTTPCGHVFHTKCIKAWISNGRNNCPQCRQDCDLGQIIKLYFSEGASENDLLVEMESITLKLEQQIKETTLRLSKSNERCFNYQQHILRLIEENLRLYRQLEDTKLNSHKIEMSSRKEYGEPTKKSTEAQKGSSPAHCKHFNFEKWRDNTLFK